MNRIKSDVLFNRALLWLILAYVTDASVSVFTLYMVCSAVNLLRAVYEWGRDYA